MGNKVAAMAGLAKSAGLNQGGQFRIWGANLEATTVPGPDFQEGSKGLTLETPNLKFSAG